MNEYKVTINWTCLAIVSFCAVFLGVEIGTVVAIILWLAHKPA